MFNIASTYSWPIHQLDINNTFLHGYLDEAVYMTPPEGYEAPSGMDAKTCTTPLPSVLKFSANEGPLLQEADRYRRLIGKILYVGFTRPDISFAVQQLNQFLQHPTQQHWDDAIHVVRYLKGSSSMALFFPSQNSIQLSAFSDADWAACVDSRRSVTGYCIFLGSLLISWKTNKQNTVSRSSTKAEYRAMATTVCELLWITYILKDFQVPLTTPVPFWCDNQVPFHITANPVFYERTKHLDIDCHIVRDKYKEGFISPRHIAGHLQPANAFTKILSVAAFTQSRVKLGLVSLPYAPT
ncbi:UNVERIFIED_CONTAM: Retrovirus-related Pol polyprotein from transposon RE2 [Sesamum radiatum]|uniref:Retrovirus-related Pol polyprotein from transposon RE2 n=1 Tax=Sesamum radiatum TaxID=300843 RepID=A0AAW2JW35_SESRA